MSNFELGDKPGDFVLRGKSKEQFNDGLENVSEIPPADWPILDARALPGLAGEFVELACRESEADPAAVLGQFLTWFGATAGTSAGIWIGDTRHVARLFAAVIGQTAKARKGTSLAPIRRLRKAIREIMGDWIRVMEGSVASGEGLIYAVRDPSEALNKEGDPVDPGVSDKRLLVIDEELAGSLKASTRQGSTASAVIRRAWDSGNLDNPTKVNPVKATGAHIAFITHITLHELAETLQSGEIHNGLVNRFIWMCARRQRVQAFPKPMPQEELERIATLVSHALIFARDAGDLCLSDSSTRLWEKVYSKLAEPEMDETVGAVTARAEAQIMRLGLIYALLDSSKEIDLIHLVAAVAFWEYCSDSARYVFESEANAEIAVVLSALASGPKTRTEISKAFHGHRTAASLKNLLKRLEAAGRIEHIQGPRKNGGRAATVYQLRPL